ncbi:protein of unknown function [Acidithiobacillus ferrivorans]|uniref:Uncharacterized protein n=1 Tax=Acidithiobacillus ferrivorans TaxID=160808 RepID=A0A060UTG9_9PROT|nr:hypothetical protein AFERRI_600133 [Acidithiobacillus ferrivorans]SMH65462.1 protein of unknown function [Acidithiobacillus ferrivorans]
MGGRPLVSAAARGAQNRKIATNESKGRSHHPMEGKYFTVEGPKSVSGTGMEASMGTPRRIGYIRLKLFLRMLR